MYNRKKVLVFGSIVYDYIMDFPGVFSDHILPDKIHMLNVSFVVNRLDRGFGGTGANIAYNLALLGVEPTLLGVSGSGFSDYRKWLVKNRVNVKYVEENKKTAMASAYIMTDKKDNQICGFFPGSIDKKYPNVVDRINNIGLGIVSPDEIGRVLGMINKFKQRKVEYIFDPGQQITCFKKPELRRAINGAFVLIGNDYEFELIKKISGFSKSDILKKVKYLVITKGGQGSVIYQKNKVYKIPPAKPKNTSDPTGAGDAYRAGLIYGLVNDLSMEKTGRLAGLISVYTVEKYGTQTHKFSWATLKKRYRENFGEKL